MSSLDAHYTFTEKKTQLLKLVNFPLDVYSIFMNIFCVEIL